MLDWSFLHYRSIRMLLMRNNSPWIPYISMWLGIYGRFKNVCIRRYSKTILALREEVLTFQSNKYHVFFGIKFGQGFLAAHYEMQGFLNLGFQKWTWISCVVWIHQGPFWITATELGGQKRSMRAMKFQLPAIPEVTNFVKPFGLIVFLMTKSL